MQIHADFSQPVFIDARDYQWVPSTQHGVERMMLDRLGAEKARATSIVRYAPDSVFPQHPHPGGEEILVLSGVFSDESGDYPAGWYLRNPPGTAHSPHSKPGAIIFVKLWQMGAADTQTVRINMHDETNWRHNNGRQVCPLYSNGHEVVSIQKLSGGLQVLEDSLSPSELLVLQGEITCDTHTYPRGSWIRLPGGDHSSLISGSDGVTFYLKNGEFANIDFSPQPV